MYYHFIERMMSSSFSVDLPELESRVFRGFLLDYQVNVSCACCTIQTLIISFARRGGSVVGRLIIINHSIVIHPHFRSPFRLKFCANLTLC